MLLTENTAIGNCPNNRLWLSSPENTGETTVKANVIDRNFASVNCPNNRLRLSSPAQHKQGDNSKTLVIPL